MIFKNSHQFVSETVLLEKNGCQSVRNELYSLKCGNISFFQHTVVTVPGDHHVHLNNPEVVAPIVSDFFKTKVLSRPASQPDELTSKL